MNVRPVIPIATLVAFSFLLFVSGCDGKKPQAEAGQNEVKKPAPRANDAESTAKPTQHIVVFHTVLEGQTLWDIARAYNVTVQEIMDANQMRPGSLRRLRKGAQLRIPKATQPVAVETAADRAAKREPLPPLRDGAYHYLRPGETLLSLVQLYDVPLDTLMERNKLTDEDLTKLRIDQPVIIPGIKSSQVKNAEPGKQAGIIHDVVKGESIWDIAHTFQISVAALMAANGLSAENATTLREGSKLLLPGVEEDRGKIRIKRYTSARQRLAALFADRLGLGTVKAASELYHGRVEQKWIRAAGGYRRLDTTLRWPVSNGWFTRGYGSGEKGYHRATDIMGKIGWNVRAAAAGIVGYSGGQVSGFGNMVILVHPGGWVTLYAHNSVNFVVAGEKVARGAVLAELGATGNALGPHVHFEFIFDGKNCDPSLILRPGVRHQNGKVSRLKYTTWASSARRPEAMRCAPRMRHPRGKAVINETPVDEGGALPPADAITPTDIVQPPDTPSSPNTDTAPTEPAPVTPAPNP
jgi:murein DD-endopeptidase MepM/ murein hydrolase activator NlpD